MRGARVEVRVAEDAADIDCVRGLMREYGEYLASGPVGPAHLCVTGYEAELAGLPGAYIAPGVLLLASVEGEAAGCVALKPIAVARVIAMPWN